MSSQPVRIDFIPLCTFGRAENIIYQSKLGLASIDLSPSELAGHLTANRSQVIAGHFLDLPYWQDYISAITSNSRTSILLSFGFEYLTHKDKLKDLNVFLLVDRPLKNYRAPEVPINNPHISWLIVGNKLYTPEEILHSLEQKGVAKEKILFTFLEPKSAKTSLLTIEEIALWQAWLTNNLLSSQQIVFTKAGIQQQDQQFFSNPSQENLQRELERTKESHPVLIYLAYLWTFISVPLSKSRINALLKSSIIEPMSIFLKWRILEPARSFVRWQIFEPLLRFYRVLVIPGLIHIKHLMTITWHHLRWSIVERILHLFRILPSYGSRGYSIFRIKVLPLLLWPFLKVYWFLEYQWRTRIRRDEGS